MTVPEVRTPLRAPSVPRQRTAERRTAEPRTVDPTPAAAPSAPEKPAARYPWPEPWGSFRGARPRTEFWDVATASWHSRGPLPRSAD